MDSSLNKDSAGFLLWKTSVVLLQKISGKMMEQEPINLVEEVVNNEMQTEESTNAPSSSNEKVMIQPIMILSKCNEMYILILRY